MIYKNGPLARRHVEFKALFELHYPALHRYANRLMGDSDAADDVAQEAFIRFLDSGVPAADARRWLFTVATNLVRDGARRSARRHRLLGAVPAGGAELPAPDEAFLQTQREAEVKAALTRLPERDRQILLMRAEGFAYREIAAVVAVAEGSVGTLVARALKRLVNEYDSNEDGDEPRE